IFQLQELLCPIIFTTAFDQYLINAFQANCIDYLLKPYTQQDVATALAKYDKIQARNAQIFNATFVEKVAPSFQKNYKSRFFVKSGNQIYSIPTEEIAFFYTEDLSTLLVTANRKRYVVNFSLDQLEAMLDPFLFFRINRQFLLHQQAIEKMEALGKGRIQLQLKFANFSALLVSRGRTPDFKEWLGR
ncbi:MAG: LytTR family DNA-binding domain-containing protein, partial [Bacteroidota bacterium]